MTSHLVNSLAGSRRELARTRPGEMCNLGSTPGTIVSCDDRARGVRSFFLSLLLLILKMSSLVVGLEIGLGREGSSPAELLVR